MITWNSTPMLRRTASMRVVLAAGLVASGMAVGSAAAYIPQPGSTPIGGPAADAPATSVIPVLQGPGGETIDGPKEPAVPGAAALPTVYRDLAILPEPVRAIRERLVEAARSGDLERLRALMAAQPEPPSVAYGDPGDPIEYLKALSSDSAGREILAILLEVLESGFVRVEPGTPEELYVWPYFAQYPLEALSPTQLVELFTLLTASDYEDMRSYGSYTFFRVGIAPDGRWLFFLAGD